VRALPAEAKMVPAEADLGVRGVECVSRGVRRSGRDQRKAETAREARSAGFIPIISKIEMVRGPGLAWPRGNGKAESGKRDQKRLWNVKKKKRRGARLRPRFLGRMLDMVRRMARRGRRAGRGFWECPLPKMHRNAAYSIIWPRGSCVPLRASYLWTVLLPAGRKRSTRGIDARTF
jgi:hypothetical protein